MLKGAVTAYTVAVLVYNMYISDPLVSFFYYLTDWGWLAVTAYFVYSFYLDSLPDCHPLPAKPLAIAGTLSEVAFSLQVVVVCMFWLVVYPQETWRNVYRELILHGSGLFLMIADYATRLTRFRMLSHRALLLFGAFYV